MASKKVYIDVVVDDKGTTKRVAVEAKKLQKALGESSSAAGDTVKSQDKLKDSTDRVSRSTRGAAQTAKSGTKNFANMASGIQGGLVPAYATLAANIFAITALFDALSRAADTAKLIAGQEALAANTGIAYKTITNSIKDATGAQISYKDAASAAAIGGAAGLSAQQLTRLGKAAKDTSLVLGRDLTDSFNRLIRGVTKAEPELLDELGIVLRLEPATQKYADSIGKSVKELSAYERSQAVANEVLSQAESKFGKAAEGADNAGESVQRLKSSFDSIVETIQTTLIQTLAPVFNFLADNTASLAAAMTLLGGGIISALTPAAPKLTSVGVAAKGADERIRGLSTGAGKLGEKLSSGTRLAAADFNQLERSVNATNSSIVNMAGQSKAAVMKDIKIARVNHNLELARMQGGWRLYAAQAKASMDVTMIQSGKLIGSFKLLARAGSLLLRAIPFVGIGLMIFDVVQMLGIGTKELSKEQQKAEESTKAFTEATDLLNKELESTNEKLRTNQLSLQQGAIAIGNMANSASLLANIDAFSKLNKDTEEYDKAQKELLKTFDILGANVPEFKDLKQQFLEGKSGTVEFRRELSTLTSDLVESSHALTHFKDAQQAVDAAINKVAGGVAVSPLANLVDTMRTADKEFAKGQKNIDRRIAGATENVSSLEEEYAKKSVDLQERQTEAAKATLEASLDLENKKAKLAKTTGGGHAGAQARRAVQHAEEELAARQEVQRTVAEEHAELANNLELSKEKKKELEEEAAQRIKDKKVFDLQQDVFEKANTKLIKSGKERIALEEEISQKKTLGITIDQKQENLRLGELADKQKVLQAEDTVTQAKAAQAALTVDGREATEAELTSAQAAVENAEAGLRIVKNNVNLNEKKRELQHGELEFQRTLNRLKGDELANTRAINAARLGLQRIEAGIGEEFGEAAARSAAAARLTLAQKTRDAAVGQQATAQAIFEETSRKAKGTGPEAKASQRQLLADQQSLDAATARAQQAQQNLDILENMDVSLKNQMRTETESLQTALKMHSLHPAQEAYNQRIREWKENNLNLDAQNLAFIKEETLKQQDLMDMLELKKGVQESIANNFTQAFQSVANGSMKAKQAFGQMAKSILADIAQMVTRLFVMKTLLPKIGLGSLVEETVVKERYGGIVEPKARAGGLFEPYAMGGIARGRDAGYPAVLHGTEAVVPLPNGREIPVEMTGGSGGTNNVSVNISMDNQGGSQQQNTADSGQMKQLGLVISGAVQEELQRQKRPGGILSPYGAA